MKRLLFGFALVLGCKAALPSVKVGQRSLEERAQLFDVPPPELAKGAFVVLTAAEGGCPAFVAQKCEDLASPVPRHDTLALMLRGAEPGSYPLAGGQLAGARALLGFSDEPGRRDIPDGEVVVTASSAERLAGTFVLKTVRGDPIDGKFDAQRCPGMLERIAQCQREAAEKAQGGK